MDCHRKNNIPGFYLLTFLIPIPSAFFAMPRRCLNVVLFRRPTGLLTCKPTRLAIFCLLGPVLDFFASIARCRRVRATLAAVGHYVFFAWLISWSVEWSY